MSALVQSLIARKATVPAGGDGGAAEGAEAGAEAEAVEAVEAVNAVEERWRWRIGEAGAATQAMRPRLACRKDLSSIEIVI
jgi:hypothetical protein